MSIASRKERLVVIDGDRHVLILATSGPRAAVEQCVPAVEVR
ncbi:hypothetical protein O4214_14920 [Rhodococcus erythropolis]|nr:MULTISPECIES: hypothetical protein [Rhodococcus erythropolis group]MCZ4525281.1 hypothetical protein [Rhodococcus erythropolis]